GFGEVYRARHAAIASKRAAVKVVGGAGARVRGCDLLQEAHAASRARHPHTIDVYDCGVHGQWSYLVTELLDAETLRARLTRRRAGLPIDEALAIGVQVATALRAAHAGRVVHLDLKPENLFLVQRDDDALFVKVLDFGIARLTDEPAPSMAPATTGGTPGYMA